MVIDLSEKKKVIILGGGVAGMSAAHELIERGFAVEVYERLAIPGGKARSVPVPDSATDGRKPLPGEHGFRFFPGFYTHIIDTMRRIPYKNNKNGVFDNLVHTTQTGLAQYGKPPVVLDAQVPWSLKGLQKMLRAIKNIDVPNNERDFFGKRLWQLMTSSDPRRLAEYEQLGWWEFLEADSKSTAYQNFFAYGLSRSLVAAQADAVSTYTMGDIILQLMFDIVDPTSDFDRLLNGPTNDVWLDPWREFLVNSGVLYHNNATLKNFKTTDGKISCATIEMDGQQFDAKGDYFIAALPVEIISPLISEDMLKIDPTLGHLRTLAPNTEWMNGLQIFLKRDVGLVHGHVNVVDSTWAVTCISQRQFWSQEFPFPDFGDGAVQGILSVVISDWNREGVLGRTARASTKEQIFQEIWEELKRSFNIGGKVVLKNEDVHSWFLDPDIIFENGPDDPDPEKKQNTEPLLVNLVNTWGLRPEAYTRIPNFFLASDYVRTNTDLASMEAANEAARRAVNCIIDVSGAKMRSCKIWPLHKPAIFEFWRSHDLTRFEKGLPWNGKTSLTALLMPRAWFYFLQHLYYRLRLLIRRWRLGK